jgi:hypothetical protein
MKKREVKEIYPERYSIVTNDPVKSGTSEVPYVWTCLNGIKLFVPYIDCNCFSKNIARRKRKIVRI